MARRPWSHYAAPAAFLLAVTIAVLLIRNTVRPDTGPPTTATTVAATTATTAPATTRSQPATTAATTSPAATAQYYAVVAGDTFGVISAKTGVPVARLEELNPGVQSTALTIGQKIRIK